MPLLDSFSRTRDSSRTGSLFAYRPERLIPFSTRYSVRTQITAKGRGAGSRWQPEIDARSQTRVTQRERRRSMENPCSFSFHTGTFVQRRVVGKES